MPHPKRNRRAGTSRGGVALTLVLVGALALACALALTLVVETAAAAAAETTTTQAKCAALADATCGSCKSFATDAARRRCLCDCNARHASLFREAGCFLCEPAVKVTGVKVGKGPVVRVSSSSSSAAQEDADADASTNANVDAEAEPALVPPPKDAPSTCYARLFSRCGACNDEPPESYSQRVCWCKCIQSDPGYFTGTISPCGSFCPSLRPEDVRSFVLTVAAAR